MEHGAHHGRLLVRAHHDTKKQDHQRRDGVQRGTACPRAVSLLLAFWLRVTGVQGFVVDRRVQQLLYPA